MIIKRKVFARVDYAGLDEFHRGLLKADRDLLAKRLLDSRNRINNPELIEDKFNLSGNKIGGEVTVGFRDPNVRISGENGLKTLRNNQSDLWEKSITRNYKIKSRNGYSLPSELFQERGKTISGIKKEALKNELDLVKVYKEGINRDIRLLQEKANKEAVEMASRRPSRGVISDSSTKSTKGLVSWAKKNPKMAIAAGVGTAGLATGALIAVNRKKKKNK